jgi:hypothetical protein
VTAAFRAITLGHLAATEMLRKVTASLAVAPSASGLEGVDEVMAAVSAKRGEHERGPNVGRAVINEGRGAA